MTARQLARYFGVGMFCAGFALLYVWAMEQFFMLCAGAGS